MNGLAFLITNLISQSSAFGVIAQMPVQVPVFKRELANNMYTPTTYFLGRYLSNLIFQLFYPVSQILITINGLGIDTSLENVGWFVSYAVALNVASCAQGYLFGSMSDDLNVAK